MKQLEILVTRRQHDGSQLRFSVSDEYNEGQLTEEQRQLLYDMEIAANKDTSLRVHVLIRPI